MIYEGEEKLKRQAENGFPKGITKICDRVYFALGYGGSTCTLVIGEESCILVDTLNGVAPAMEVRKEFEKLTDKPVRTIIYTHYFHSTTPRARRYSQAPIRGLSGGSRRIPSMEGPA